MKSTRPKSVQPHVLCEIDSRLRLNLDGIDAQHAETIAAQIRSELTFENVDKKNAQREHQGGWWEMPDEIALSTQFNLDGVEYVNMPRGFAGQLVEGLSAYGYRIRWVDNRSYPFATVGGIKPVDLRDYQQQAAKRIAAMEQGIWKAPPAAGKTVTVLELIRGLQTRALVVVDKANIAQQWHQRADEFLGITMGLIGDNVFDERDVTVALQQTLWARRDELEQDGFFDRWGFVCLDECHHLPARTFTDTVQRFSSKYRIGVSGTPAKQDWHLPIMEASIGPLFHETSKAELRAAGWLMKPSVRLIDTGFKRLFWPTHRMNPKLGRCGFTYCTREKNKNLHRNNYSEVIADLIRDDERNRLIALDVARSVDEGRCCLVISKRLEHLGVLLKLVRDLTGSERLWAFTGQQTTEERMEIQAQAEDGSCALFSTIADEALDIPRADTLFLTFPTRNTGTVEQQIGRVERPHPLKAEPIVYDYADDVGPMRGQLSDRLLVYKDQQLLVEATALY